MPTGDPIVVRWRDGAATLGYLGALRWRVTIGGLPSTEAEGIVAAVRQVFDALFAGVAPGGEAAARSPIEIDLAGEPASLVSVAKLRNGWGHASSRTAFDIGPHAALLPFVADLLGAAADRAWATGVAPIQPPPLAPRFAFARFAVAADREALCRDLALALEDRMRSHPSPIVAFEAAMQELKAAGHDLWSWELHQRWGHDYVTPRPGAGLMVSRDADDDAIDSALTVTFSPR